MNKEKIMVIGLGILLIVVAIQTIQLNVMAQKINAQEKDISVMEANVKQLAEANLTTGGYSGGGASLALEKLKELPKMVGGC